MGDYIIALDTETGGLDPVRHSLLEVGLVAWNRKDDKMHSVRRFHRLPEYIVQTDALAVNKLDLLDVHAKGVETDELVNDLISFAHIHEGLNGGIRPTLLGHGLAMDIAFLEHLFASVNESFHDHFNYHTIDTAVLVMFGKSIKKLPINTSMGLYKALQDLEVPIEGEQWRHTALGDAYASIFLYKEIQKRILV